MRARAPELDHVFHSPTGGSEEEKRLPREFLILEGLSAGSLCQQNSFRKGHGNTLDKFMRQPAPTGSSIMEGA